MLPGWRASSSSCAPGRFRRRYRLRHALRLATDTDVTIGRLGNGLRYYVRPNQGPENRAELRLVVAAGSAPEDEGQRGVAHLLEHMASGGRPISRTGRWSTVSSPSACASAI